MARVLHRSSRLLTRRSYVSSSARSDAGTNMPGRGERVIVAMSGGVDSSVTARLLVDQDYDLSAIFMRNWDTRDESGSNHGCEWERDWEDVQKVCRHLSLPCEMIDLSREYWTRVFEPSLKDWEAGITPNPDVYCNREIKFGALLDHLTTGRGTAGLKTWLATGHYARKSWSPCARPMLLRAADRTKDQTYYLSSISEKGLSLSFFPLGNFTKTQVRELAHKFKLPTASREESMGVCFVGERRRFSEFLSQYIPPNPGPIVNLCTGECVGKHQGLWTFTIGQGAKVPGMSEKMYVAQKDDSTNTIFVVPGTNHMALYCNKLHCNNWHWIWADCPPSGLDDRHGLQLRMQYRHVMSDVLCTIRSEKNGEITIIFDEPQKAVAPGQIAAVWDKDVCLGSGMIFRVS